MDLKRKECQIGESRGSPVHRVRTPCLCVFEAAGAGGRRESV